MIWNDGYENLIDIGSLAVVLETINHPAVTHQNRAGGIYKSMAVK